MPFADLAQLLHSLSPARNDGVYCFVVVPFGTDLMALRPIATIAEREGLSLVVEESVAISHRLSPLFRAAWITLGVHSDLNAVGLTAAVSGALADAGISCNVVAGAVHDHLFVPIESADETIRVLQRLSASVAR
jgi:hypothetical protein